jgi:CobQ/CobB/MinD/ParA family nucleotide binding protein
MKVRFDEAWSRSKEVAKSVATKGVDVVLIRDLLGRISLAINDKDPSIIPENLEEKIAEAASAFTSPAPILYSSSLFNPASILESPDLNEVPSSGGPQEGSFNILERGIVGGDWLRPRDLQNRRRVTLYGFKGGVGRSTATFLLAQNLAAAGRCVLVVDLDLESPGVGSLLQEEGELSDYGVVDYLVESAVGNERGLDLVSRSKTINVAENGEVWVASASGRPRVGYDYISKLNRVYSDLPPDSEGNLRTFASRLNSAIEACEFQVAEQSRKPDVVLLDSRAGIHDIAAVAITQLSTIALLFAADSPQTWSGYRALFSQWQASLNPDQRDYLRRRLRMVASMVPPATSEEYLMKFRDRAQECFADTLYDDETESIDLDAFNFGTDDEAAPHYALPITFSIDLVGIDASNNRNWHRNPLVTAAYAEFLSSATKLVLDEGA